MKKIYINPGHSNNDPGAIGYEVERKLTVKVSNYMNEYLRSNYECETKMNPGTIDSLTTISNDANAWGADLVVSNHFNAGGGDGYEALIYNSNRNALGRCFEKYVKATGQNSRGVKPRPDLGILRLTNAPAIINEGAFVDNWTDIKDWNDDAELQVLGTAYAKAAAEYLSLPAKKTASGSGGASFEVRVTEKDLNIRTGPGTSYKSKGYIKPGVYTIVETQGSWGRLKSGAGWIHLSYAKKI
jgi:N-acetylmuramoyl-L-alanine amidase